MKPNVDYPWLIVCFLTGTRQSCEDHGVEPQRQLDDHWRPFGLRQVLAVEHEQRENVPSTQRSASWHKVSTTSLRISKICTHFLYFAYQ